MWNTVCHENEQPGEVESHLLDVPPLVASDPMNIEHKREQAIYIIGIYWKNGKYTVNSQ